MRMGLGGPPTLRSRRQGLGCGFGERHRRVAQELVEPVVVYHNLVGQSSRPEPGPCSGRHR